MLSTREREIESSASPFVSDDEGDVFDNPNAAQERQRLKFINAISGNKKRWQKIEDQLNEVNTEFTVHCCCLLLSCLRDLCFHTSLHKPGG